MARQASPRNARSHEGEMNGAKERACPYCKKLLTNEQIKQLYRFTVAKKSGRKGGKVSGSRPGAREKMSRIAKIRWDKERAKKAKGVRTESKHPKDQSFLHSS